jgi:glycosyltransferase involved in cell wall biosynthesis
MTNKPRILFVQVNVNPPGGAQAVAAWALEALKADYAVTLLTWHPPRWQEVNRFYGTQLQPAQFCVRSAPAWLRWLVARDPHQYSFQPLAFLMRAARWMAREHDLAISFNDEVDLGVPSLQYIHYPWLAKHYHAQSRAVPASWRAHIVAFLRRQRPWRIISGFDFDRMRHNLTLVNSDWTGKLFQAHYGTAPRTLYPPIWTNTPPKPWAERENGFVSIGRISPEKKYERTIAILERVRARGYTIHLHIVGAPSQRERQSTYYRTLRASVARHAQWIEYHENISREDLRALIAAHRYGIHGHTTEHFGIAPAEMMCGGALVFVPHGGGQAEIVGGEPRLLYASPDDAVEKITRVLDDADAQRALGAQLAARAELFRMERFTQELRALVQEALCERTPSALPR